MPDLIFESHGSLVTMEAATPVGVEWVRQHIPAEAMRWMNRTVIEPRYVDDIVIGAGLDGLVIETRP